MILTDRIIKRGDSDNFSIKFTDVNGAPINLTNWKVWFTVRKNPAETYIKDDTDAPISVEVTGLGVDGVVPINIPSEKTDIASGTYYYEIQYTDSVGNTQSSSTCKYIILNDITRDR